MSLKLEDHAEAEAETAHAAHGMPHSAACVVLGGGAREDRHSSSGRARPRLRQRGDRLSSAFEERECSTRLHPGSHLQGRGSPGQLGRPELQEQLRRVISPADRPSGRCVRLSSLLFRLESLERTRDWLPRSLFQSLDSLPAELRNPVVLSASGSLRRSRTRPKSMRRILFSLFFCTYAATVHAQGSYQGFRAQGSPAGSGGHRRSRSFE